MQLAIFITAFLSCAAVTYADSCLSVPFPGGNGAACNDYATCSMPLVCNINGVCSDAIADGQPCNSTTSYTRQNCGPNSVCKGPNSPSQAQVCVPFAGPGRACSTNPSVTTPSCYPGLSCNTQTNKCTGGLHGDSCLANADCLSNSCSSGFCVGIATGSACTISNSNPCRPGAHCYFNLQNSQYQCLADAQLGEDCSVKSCTVGTVCVPKSSTNSNVTCVDVNSLSAGDFCGDQPIACSSYRSVDGYCVSNSVGTCLSASDCSANQICQCGKYSNYNGYGSCTGNSCFTLTENLYTCLYQSCASTALSYNYPSFSCAAINCASQIQSLGYCGSATSLAASLLTTFVFALFALIFNK